MTVARTHVRWFPILALVAFGTMLNYLDRTVLGIAAPSLTKDLGLSAALMGIAFSAFSWSYALLQIPGGIALDRFGTRTTYIVALFFWSLFTAAMGLVRSLTGLVITRIGVGLNPLQGLRVCGQFDSTARASTSARSST